MPPRLLSMSPEALPSLGSEGHQFDRDVGCVDICVQDCLCKQHFPLRASPRLIAIAGLFDEQAVGVRSGQRRDIAQCNFGLVGEGLDDLRYWFLAVPVGRLIF